MNLGLDINWRSMETAPRDGRPILAECDHSRAQYAESPDRLTPYGAHCEGPHAHAPDGYCLIEWGGEYLETDWEGGTRAYIPDWWFMHGTEFTRPANPLRWAEIPEGWLRAQQDRDEETTEVETAHLTPPLEAIYPALLAEFYARFASTANARPSRSEWTHMCGVINLYHRVGVRSLLPDAPKHYTIANISIADSRQGEGIFTNLLGLAEGFCDSNGMSLVVECVHNVRLYEFLVRRGYAPDQLYVQNLVREARGAQL